MESDLIVNLFFGIGAIGIVCAMLAGYYSSKLKSLMQEKYHSLYKKFILVDVGSILFVKKPLGWYNYVWFGRSYPKDIRKIVSKIRLFQKLALAILVLALTVAVTVSSL